MVWIYKSVGSRILTARPGRMQGAERPEEMGGDGGGGRGFSGRRTTKTKLIDNLRQLLALGKGQNQGVGQTCVQTLVLGQTWSNLSVSFPHL